MGRGMTSVADLSGVKAKLGRAYVHLRGLAGELQALEEQYADVPFLRFQEEGDWKIVLIEPPVKYPIELSLIAGDMCNNLRAALDHLVWQMVIREGKKPRLTNHFPIFESEKTFVSRVKSPTRTREKDSALYGLPVDGDAWTLVEREQPWYRSKLDGSDATKDILVSLRKMTNVDKHRGVLVSMGVADRDTLEEVVAWTPSETRPVEVRLAPWSVLSYDHATELARFRFPPGSDVRMHVNGRLPIGPTFGDEKFQVAGLQVFCTRVAEIVDEFAALPRVHA